MKKSLENFRPEGKWHLKNLQNLASDIPGASAKSVAHRIHQLSLQQRYNLPNERGHLLGGYFQTLAKAELLFIFLLYCILGLYFLIYLVRELRKMWKMKLEVMLVVITGPMRTTPDAPH